MKLKQCPFCGSDAIIVKNEGNSFPYRVECLYSKCGCRTDNFTKYEGAIKSWNRRVGEQDATSVCKCPCEYREPCDDCHYDAYRGHGCPAEEGMKDE